MGGIIELTELALRTTLLSGYNITFADASQVFSLCNRINCRILNSITA